MSYRIQVSGVTVECDSPADVDQFVNRIVRGGKRTESAGRTDRVAAENIAANDNAQPVAAPSLVSEYRNPLTITQMILNIMHDGKPRKMSQAIEDVMAKYPGVKEGSVRTMVCVLRKNKKLSASGVIHSRLYKATG